MRDFELPSDFVNPIAEYCRQEFFRRHERAESRVLDFMRRTGLKVDEIQMIYIQRTGEYYPQWRWAAELVPVVSAGPD